VAAGDVHLQVREDLPIENVVELRASLFTGLKIVTP
jgi:hypothetical protein